MKTETKVLIYSMLNNLIISTLKIIGGFSLGLSSLFADGLHTFCDFITDIICMIGTKISKHKPTKLHPFGFGKIEYLNNLFIGAILFLLGIFIIINGIKHDVIVPPLSLLILLLSAILLKILAIFIMRKVGQKINSQVLITSVEESKMDLISSLVVALITVVLQFTDEYPWLKYADLIGSIFIGLIVMKTALSIIVDNSLSIIGEVETNKDIIKKVEDFVSEFKGVEKQEVTLIKSGSYYQLHLVLELDHTLTLRQVTNLENKIKRSIIRHTSLDIKYVTIYVTNKLD